MHRLKVVQGSIHNGFVGLVIQQVYEEHQASYSGKRALSDCGEGPVDSVTHDDLAAEIAVLGGDVSLFHFQVEMLPLWDDSFDVFKIINVKSEKLVKPEAAPVAAPLCLMDVMRRRAAHGEASAKRRRTAPTQPGSDDDANGSGSDASDCVSTSSFVRYLEKIMEDHGVMSADEQEALDAESLRQIEARVRDTYEPTIRPPTISLAEDNLDGAEITMDTTRAEFDTWLKDHNMEDHGFYFV